VQIEHLSELEEKVANILEKYELLKKDKEKIEARLASKNKENEDVKKHLGKILEERNVIKRKLDGLIEKIDSLEAKTKLRKNNGRAHSDTSSGSEVYFER
jgi:chromosome segregation ATPase